MMLPGLTRTAVLALALFLSGCAQKTGDAVITGKEHFPAAEPGTTPGKRQLSNPQWIINVEMVKGGRKIDVHVDETEWQRRTKGERVLVSYSEGKYTGTVWGAEIK